MPSSSDDSAPESTALSGLDTWIGVAWARGVGGTRPLLTDPEGRGGGAFGAVANPS